MKSIETGQMVGRLDGYKICFRVALKKSFSRADFAATHQIVFDKHRFSTQEIASSQVFFWTFCNLWNKLFPKKWIHWNYSQELKINETKLSKAARFDALNKYKLLYCPHLKKKYFFARQNFGHFFCLFYKKFSPRGLPNLISMVMNVFFILLIRKIIYMLSLINLKFIDRRHFILPDFLFWFIKFASEQKLEIKGSYQKCLLRENFSIVILYWWLLLTGPLLTI